MDYTVNLGCWGSIFAVPTEVVDKHLKIAGSAQLKVLLYILRHSNESFSDSDIAAALNMDAFDVRDCVEFWTSFGIIKLSQGVITPAETAPSAPVKQAAAVRDIPRPQTVSEPVPEVKAEPKAEEAPVKKEPERPSATVVARPLRPDPVYVAQRVNEDMEIASLLTEAQYTLGRPVSPNENATLIMLHDNDGLPCEVILMLLNYGVSNQMGTKQIAALGAAWAREGITTLELADEKIRKLDENKEAYRKVQKLFGLERRNPSKAEEETYSRWVNEWKFSDEMLKAAYDKCINAKHEYIPNWINKVLKSWYDQGIRTPDMIDLDKKYKQSPAQSTNQSSGYGSGNSSFDIDDLRSFGILSE